MFSYNSFLITFALILFYFFNSIFSEVEDCFKREGLTVVTKTDAVYEKHNWQLWVSNVYHFPQGYILVRNVSDIQKTIYCAKINEIHLAIKSGGHSLEGYSYGCNHSWIIDLKLLDQIEINADDETVTVGSGVIVGKLEDALWDKRYFIPAGNEKTIGISGIALGGGVGYMTRKYGLLVDSILEVEVVTADGKIHIASEEKKSDLFWALRGAGGGNFGVVTKLKLKIYKPPKSIVTIHKSYDKNYTSLVFNEWQKYFTSKDADKSISSSLHFNFMEDSKISFLLVILTETETESNLLVEKMKNLFPNIFEKDLKRYDSYIDLRKDISQGVSDLRGADPLCVTMIDFFVSKTLNSEEANKAADIILSLSDSKNWIFANTFGGEADKLGRQTNAWVHRGTQYDFIIGSLHCRKQVKRTALSVVEKLKFMDNGESYQNYISFLLSDHLKRCYGENLQKLIQLKNEYDSKNFFCFPQSIPLDLNNSKKKCSCSTENFSVVDNNFNLEASEIFTHEEL